MTLETEIDQLSAEEVRKHARRIGRIHEYKGLAKSLPSLSPLLRFISTLFQTGDELASFSEHYAKQVEMNDSERQLFQIGFFLGLMAKKQFPNEFKEGKPIFVVGVLRSGWAIARGVAEAVDGVYLSSTYDVTTQSNQKIIPDFARQPGATIVIADDLLYLASTLKQTENEVVESNDFDLLYVIGLVNLEYAFFAANHPVLTLSAFGAN